MKLLFPLFAVFFFACNKEKYLPIHGVGIKSLWILRDTLTGDTGRYWNASSIVVTRSEWDADSNRYYPTNDTTYRNLKNQKIFFKSVDSADGTFTASDTLAMLLRVPEQGSFWTKAAPDNHALRLGLNGDSNELLFFVRYYWNTRNLKCFRIYSDSPKVQYTIETVLSKQQ